MNAEFPDHFSAHAEEYRLRRPRYPEALFDWLGERAPRRELVWDCATGNGQAALGLATRFERVVGTDASRDQVGHAERHRRVAYAVCLAERCCLGNGCVDLVSVAQALHWLDRDAFWKEVRRVGRPGALVAAWCYGLCRISPEVDGSFLEFYRETVGPYWPGERSFIDDRYRSIEFPFEELTPPELAIETEWTLGDLLRYVGTWSSVQRYRRAKGGDPLERLRPRLASLWEDPAARRRVVFPLHFRVGRLVG